MCGRILVGSTTRWEEGEEGGLETHIQKARGIQSRMERTLQFLTTGWQLEGETNRQLPVWTFLIDLWFGFLCSFLQPPEADFSQALSCRDTICGLLFGLKMDIIMPWWCLVSAHTKLVLMFSKFPGVTWQLLECEPSLWSPPTSDLLAPDLISSQPSTYTILLNLHVILWRVDTPVIPVLLMRKLRLTLVISNSTGIQIQVLELFTGSMCHFSGSLNSFFLSPAVFLTRC